MSASPTPRRTTCGASWYASLRRRAAASAFPSRHGRACEQALGGRRARSRARGAVGADGVGEVRAGTGTGAPAARSRAGVGGLDVRLPRHGHRHRQTERGGAGRSSLPPGGPGRPRRGIHGGPVPGRGERRARGRREAGGTCPARGRDRALLARRGRPPVGAGAVPGGGGRARGGGGAPRGYRAPPLPAGRSRSRGRGADGTDQPPPGGARPGGDAGLGPSVLVVRARPRRLPTHSVRAGGCPLRCRRPRRPHRGPLPEAPRGRLRRRGPCPGPAARAGCRVPPARRSATESCWRTWRRGSPWTGRWRRPPAGPGPSPGGSGRGSGATRASPGSIRAGICSPSSSSRGTAGDRVWSARTRARRDPTAVTEAPTGTGRWETEADGRRRRTAPHQAPRGGQRLPRAARPRRPAAAVGGRGARPVRPPPGYRGRRRPACHRRHRAGGVGDGPSQRRRRASPR